MSPHRAPEPTPTPTSNAHVPDERRSCPCGSGGTLRACCGDFLQGLRAAPTASALMRSRYTAFVLRRADYLLDTWAPEHRPPTLDLSADATEWLGLQILDHSEGGPDDRTGTVTFVASFRLHGVTQQLHETSRFRRQPPHDRWVYVDGDTRHQQGPAAATAKAGRNDPCPCGSGKKYKRCCG